MIRIDFSKSGVQDSELPSVPPLQKAGFLDLPFNENCVEIILKKAKEISYRFKNLLVLGIGGSSVGLKAVAQALQPSAMILTVQESTDPASVARLLETIDWTQTCLVPISKSGNTMETLTLLNVFQEALTNKVGKKWKDHLVVITGENRGELFKFVQKEKLFSFPIPEEVGGRFSVLSAVGLFPLACLGVDIRKLLRGAAHTVENPDDRYGAAYYEWIKNHGKTVSVLMCYADRLQYFGDWYTQLWAESLGKNGNGQTPIACLGPQAQHSLAQLILDGPKDKVVTFIKITAPKGERLGLLMEKECEATARACQESGVPSITLTLPDLGPQTLGKLLMFFQMQTAVTASLLEINPYDQPAVDRIKKWL